MLLITRRTGEAVVINGDIVVKVLEVRGGRVKLGCEYPAGSSVFRQELFEKIREENQAAAGSGARQEVPAGLARLLQNVGKTNNKERDHAAKPTGKPTGQPRRDGDEPAE